MLILVPPVEASESLPVPPNSVMLVPAVLLSVSFPVPP